MRQNISQLTKIILILELIIALYMMVVLFKSLYDSYQIETYLTEFEIKNEEIQSENEKLAAELAYYTSEQYQDKIAKQNFGLVNPGEEVLILPHTPEPGSIDLQEEQLSRRLQFYQDLPVHQKWWYLITEN